MNGPHDMGGAEHAWPIHTDPNEPLFHHDWEKRVLALALAMGASGSWNLDQSRFARESLPENFYLSAGYYRIWLRALERLLVKHSLVTSAELAAGRMMTQPKKISRVLQAKDVEAALLAGSPVTRETDLSAKFLLGDKVRLSETEKPTHTRLPAYIRGQVGEIVRVHGYHVFPDSHADGLGEDPRWLYAVKFDSETLWANRKKSGSNARPFSVTVDCWEPYLNVL